MKRIVVIALLLWPALAFAHVGSPDVFLEGDAGPYRLFVTVRVPQVIPGVATIEIRSESPDVTGVTVVPMRLTGPGSELPPTPDRAARSAADPQFFTASLWLMERGSLQVRISVDGARGPGRLAVPVPASAQRTLAMTRGLGGLLVGLMLVLCLAIVGIIAGAIREATLEVAVAPPPRARRHARIATLVVGAGVVGLVALGNAWWDAEAATYRRFVLHPWKTAPRLDGCRLEIPDVNATLLADHGHDMHLFLVRVPALDRMVHVHPQRLGDGGFAQSLPSMSAGHYLLFADIVLDTGFPITGTGALDIPELTCPPLAGDDSTWSRDAPQDDITLVWDRPPALRAGVALSLRFHAENPDGTPAVLEPYMGMTGHAEIVRADGTVFAHIHPGGTAAMPALDLARGGDMAGMAMPMPPQDLAFPFGFPQPGDYRVFVQVKHAGRVVTGAFDAHVE